MKTIRLLVVFVVVAVMTGCATDTGTGAAAGGLLGGGLAKAAGGSATKGAIAGAAIGAGLGVLSDAQNRKDTERSEKIQGLIYDKTSGGNDSAAAQAAATAESNLAFAEQQRRKCEAKYGTYKKNGVRVPHDCQAEFNQALADADYAAETNSPEVLHATMRGGYGQYDGVRRGSPHEAYWRYWGTVGPDIYNRQNGYYGYRRY